MPTTTPHTVQLAALLAGCRAAAVAAEAGVGAAAWASTTSPRVMPGDKRGYVRGLHRGRLPAVEVFCADQGWEHQAASGGTIRTTWTLRAHHNGPTWEAAEAGARGILLVALAVLRATAYLDEGGETFRPMVATPLGYAVECDVECVHVYDRATYETGAIPPPEPDNMASGTTFLVDITTDPAGVIILNMPANQALDNVEVHVLEAWDGVGASIQVGKAGSPAAYFAAGEVDLATAGETTEADFDEAGPLSILVTVTPGAGATTGQARVQVSTTVKGT